MTARAICVGAMLVAAVSVSVAGGPPHPPLPEVALGWSVLLHLERGVALLLIGGTAFLLLWRATQGRFPIRFGDFFEFEATERHSVEARESLEGLQEQVHSLRDLLVDLMAERVERADGEE